MTAVTEGSQSAHFALQCFSLSQVRQEGCGSLVEAGAAHSLLTSLWALGADVITRIMHRCETGCMLSLPSESLPVATVERSKGQCQWVLA